MSFEKLTAWEAADAIAAGRLSAEGLAQSILGQIAQHQDLNAFTSIDPERVMNDARDADQRAKSGQSLGPLHGVPISFKDSINVFGHPTTAGTKALSDFWPDCDAPVVERLRQSGAVMLGKVGMHELAYGATSQNPAFGTPRNPHDRSRTAGGSSGGSGTAVAGCLGPVSIGTDTGGSVRIPAAFCGAWGYRPTIGRWPTAGIVPISTSRDTPGPLARSARDLVLIDRCVTGQTTEHRSLKGMRIGVSERYFWEDASPEVAALCQAALCLAEKEGAELVKVDASDLLRPHLESTMIVPIYEGRIELEAFLVKNGLSLDYAMVGDLVSSLDVRAIFDSQRDPKTRITEEAYRMAATVHRPALIDAAAGLFERNRIDLLACPTTLIEAPILDGPKTLRLGHHDMPVFEAIIHNADILSNAGFTGVSVPVGMTSRGLPVGLALDAPSGGDSLVLAAAMAFERAMSTAFS